MIATTTIVPAVPQALSEFHVSGSSTYQILLVSVWELGEGVGPFAVAPLSERFGRMPIYHAGNVLALLFAIAGALSTSASMLIAMRFLNGCCMTALTLAPAIVGDLYLPDHRGSAMVLVMGLRVLGAFVAPIMGSFVAQELGWRWSIWIVVIGIGAVAALSLVFVRETYAVIILERRAARLRDATGNMRLHTKYHKRLSSTTILLSVTRPIRLLILSPVVFIVSFYTAICYGLSYLILTTLTEIMESQYQFGQNVVGLAFLGPVVGNVFGMFFYMLTSDRYIRYMKHKAGGVLRPEHRLITMVLAGTLLPLGYLIYGWTLNFHVVWIAPLIGTGLIGFSVVLAILPTENYLVDVYQIHGASAIAAGVILRAVSGALFPLVALPLYARLGLGWGNSVLAFIALGMIPMIILLWRYGERLRTPRLLQDK